VRIPWGVPTVGDATKLGLAPVCGPLATKITAGQRLYALLHQALVTENFANLTAWSETDADAKVNLSGGEVSMDGDGAAFTTHGLSYTAGITSAEGYFEVKFKTASAAASGYFGINSADALALTYAAPNFRQLTTGPAQAVYRANVVNTNGQAYSADTYYTLRLYIQKDSVGALKMVTATIQGGTEFPNEMVLEVMQTAALAATIYPQLMRFTSNSGRLTYFKEFRWFSGFSTAGQTLTYVADAGAGKLFNGFVPTNLAAIGSWATTNVTFAYSFDDGVASYSAEKTLAQLNAEAALTTNKRYIRLRITVNSDGATQQYAGELNADDATDIPAVADLPDVGNVRDTDTVGGATGTLSSNKILKSNSTGSGAGGYNDDNLSAPNVRVATAFGVGLTGELVEEAHVQSTKPGTWNLTDSGDGQTWTLTVDDADNSIVYKLKDTVANKYVASALLKSTYPNGAKIKGLTAEHTYQLYALEAGKLISEPADDTVEAPELTANYSAGAENILTGSADRVDGTVTNGTATGTPAAPATPTGLAIADLGTGKGGKATITNSGSYAATDELIVTDAGIKAEVDVLGSGFVVVAKLAGTAGNDISIAFNPDVGPAPVYSENGDAITVAYDPSVHTWQDIKDVITSDSTLVDVPGSVPEGLFTPTGGYDLADGAEPLVIGRGTFAEYALNSGCFCPNVLLGTARTGDKAKAASGLTSASESAYSDAAASWTPTDQFPGGPNFNGGFN